MRSIHGKVFYRIVLITACAVWLVGATAAAQTGDGTLVGNVTDAQGGVLPGVTVTATGPALQGERVAVSDGTGYYRLRSLRSRPTSPASPRPTAPASSFEPARPSPSTSHCRSVPCRRT